MASLQPPVTRYVWSFLILFFVGLGSGSGVWGDEPPVPELAPERLASVVVRSVRQICEPRAPCVTRTTYGSGTIIGKFRGRYAVLTCSHILQNRAAHTVQVDGVVHQAYLIAIDPKVDLALVV